MLRERPVVDIAALNAQFADTPATEILAQLIGDGALGDIALVSSFGAESVVLLHMISEIDRDFPVVFLDTEMLFPETLAYQRELAATLGLRNIRHIAPDRAAIKAQDPYAILHRTDTNACCKLRKGAPLDAALTGYDSWITGRKRFQGGARQNLELAEIDPRSGKIKLNPLWNWQKEELRAYMTKYTLPAHPLTKQGFASIGCQPCTAPVDEGEDERAGRWRGQEKTECGIHLSEATPVGPKNLVLAFDSAPVDATYSAVIDPAEGVDFEPRLDTDHVTILFGSFADGRGFGIARALRRAGYRGRLRAKGNLIPDQYMMAKRVGFDEVEILAETAARQSEAAWRRHAARIDTGYQARLGQSVGV